MVHLFGRRAGDDKLIQLGRRVGQDILNIEVRAADLTVRLNRQYSPQKILILRILFFEILKFYFVGKHPPSFGCTPQSAHENSLTKRPR